MDPKNENQSAQDQTGAKGATDDQFHLGEKELLTVYNNVSDVIYYLRVEPGDVFRFVFVNDTFIKATGLVKSQVIGKLVTEVIPQPAHELILGNYKKAIREKQTVWWEEVSKYPTGTKYGSVSVTPIFDEKGLCTGLAGTVQDITKLKESEKQLSMYAGTLEAKVAERTRDLATAIQKNERMLESIGDGVVAIDRYWNIILWNKAASTLSGWSDEEAMGKPFREIVKFVRERDGKEDIAFIEETMLFGRVKQMVNNTVLITKTGTEIPVGDSAAPILSADGKVDGAIIVFRDATQDREVKRMKDEFISVTSHELRTPMTAISGFVSMILDGVYGPVNEDLKEPLGYIGEGSDRLIKLVSDMLNVSRIEAGRLKFELTSLDLGKFASEVVKSLKPVAQEKGISLSFKETETPLIQADADKVRQILNNLIGNALKFTDKGGSITVSLTQEENFVKTNVTDTGIGIALEDQKKLFEKFSQIASQENGRPKGTGLGLYISRELTRKMGGEMWVESSEIGKGSTFAFSLPLADTELAKKTFEGLGAESGLHPDQKSLEKDIAKEEK